MVQFEDAACVS